MAQSPYLAVWLIALFDLPTDTPEARKAYTGFRKFLLSEGFDMLQYSVYARYCSGEDKAKGIRRKVKQSLPPDGEVRVMTLTDTQYGKMQIYHGKLRKPPTKAPGQVEMF